METQNICPEYLITLSFYKYPISHIIISHFFYQVAHFSNNFYENTVIIVGLLQLPDAFEDLCFVLYKNTTAWVSNFFELDQKIVQLFILCAFYFLNHQLYTVETLRHVLLGIGTIEFRLLFSLFFANDDVGLGMIVMNCVTVFAKLVFINLFFLEVELLRLVLPVLELN